jgi:hypothetical protein
MTGPRLRERIAHLQRRQPPEPALGVCPHPPWRYSYAPCPPVAAGPLAAADTAPLPPCPCGRPRGEVVVHLPAEVQPGQLAAGRRDV